MNRNKRLVSSVRKTRLALLPLVLPLAFLAAYLADAPILLPSFLLPSRRYLACSSLVPAEELARIRGEAFAVLADRLAPLPGARDQAGLEAARSSLPDFPALEPALADIESGIGLFKRAAIICSSTPSAREIARIEEVSRRSGTPIRVEVLPRASSLPLLALRRTYYPRDRDRRFDLLLAPGARDLERVEVSAPAAGGGRRVLYSSTGADLPGDLVLRLSAGPSEAVDLAFVSRGGEAASRRLDLGGEGTERPKVLVVTENPAPGSFVESAYSAARASPAEAAGLDLHAYELVVLDGLALRGIEGSLLASLLDVLERRTGSLLFVADSPAFGSKGANPEIEARLPASLLPRSLRDVPDLAMLVLVDASGSMFGEKLSLAKVTGLELLRGLKPGDLVGLGLFSDRRRWLYGFAPASGLAAAPELEPLSAGGGTDLHAALSDGLDRITRVSMGQRHAVVITDGVTRPADFRSLAERARSLGVSVSAMGVGEDADRALLERLAIGTDGRYYQVTSADEIPSLILQDRSNAARPAFAEGRRPVLSLDGRAIAWVGGMCQYTASPTAEVLLANELGDPLLACREYGNRAVLLFASDIHGAYTGELFASREATRIFKDRLDALFAEEPTGVSIAELARGLAFSLRSDRLVSPRLLLSRPGSRPLEFPMRREGDSSWVAEAVPPYAGRWSAAILDRGASLASFPVAVNGGLAGEAADAAAALGGYHPLAFRRSRSGGFWLLVFFASSLACTIYLRTRR